MFFARATLFGLAKNLISQFFVSKHAFMSHSIHVSMFPFTDSLREIPCFGPGWVGAPLR